MHIVQIYLVIFMAQMHFYVPDHVAEIIRKQAKSAGLSVSKYLVQKINMDLVDQWPADYAESVFGSWQGKPLTREPEGEFETQRDW